MKNRERQSSLEKLSKYVEKARYMEGWDLDEVKRESVGPGPSWDYVARARELVADAQAVLDMGTGGGEVFSTICEVYAGLAVATEAWHPNVSVAARRLSARGTEVVHASGSNLPFASQSFDVVLNSHEDLSPPDVARVLRPGGCVLTQQVGRNEWQEIAQFFPRTSKEGRPDRFHTYQAGFESAGLTVIFARSHDTPVAYHSLGDVVYMFTVVMPQWRNHDFDLEHDLDALLALERELSGEKGIILTESRFVIEAVKAL